MLSSNMLFALLAGAAAAIAAAAQPFAGTGSLPMALRMVEIQAGDQGHYVTTATIDHIPVIVLVDTGASKVALSYEDAERIGLNPFGLNFDQPVTTANGVVGAALVTLDRIEVENVVVRDVGAIVLPQGAMRGTLLGMSFLNRLSGFRISDGTLYLEE